jgi:hypothetical protein
MGHSDSELQVRYVSWAGWSSVWYFERGVWVWGGDVLVLRAVHKEVLFLYNIGKSLELMAEVWRSYESAVSSHCRPTIPRRRLYLTRVYAIFHM